MNLIWGVMQFCTLECLYSVIFHLVLCNLGFHFQLEEYCDSRLKSPLDLKGRPSTPSSLAVYFHV